ncbi:MULTISPECIES: hypothetical protein [Roseomonadaceae]|uniref:Uncharacterized protein n=1 Tax=Falsiroseomonas oleicola TaxID=2801474 RepID=A0ABS6HBH2_9PROT|nr:hypothetical protein [Roseomonas oleicola]MBU8545157.1 hypothetical protein [Roseomonas oleicola]
MAIWTMTLALGLPTLALAQGSAASGPNAGALHGQNWDMRQDLHTPTQPGAPPQTRTQRLRQQAREAEARRRAEQRARQQQQRARQTQAPR